jgi:hypothetical protein
MDAALASLPERLGTPVDLALKRLHSGVSKIMLNQVLLEGKLLSALFTNPLLVNLVYLHVPLKTILGLKDLTTPEDVAAKHPFTLFLLIKCLHL